MAQGDMITTPDNGIGYMMGASYEQPEIALKSFFTQPCNRFCCSNYS